MITLLSILAMLLGFGFVIFWHELGHFLGCRLAGIRVEQFAVGMGHAIVSYRKGIGVVLGNTQKEFERRTDQELESRERKREEDAYARGDQFAAKKASDLTTRERYDIARDLGLGETEYRLSMLPIGGYVKPTGQDDLRPAADVNKDDPGSFAAASVGHRMIMISAGVIMNVILAAILFFVLFQFIGFNSIRSVVGVVQSASPAAEAGLKAGDELLSIDGKRLHDFIKLPMNVALLPSDRAVPLIFRRDGQEQTVQIQPRKTRETSGMLAIGVQAAQLLHAMPAKELSPEDRKELDDPRVAESGAVVLKAGERIVAVDGAPVTDTDYAKLDRAIQASFGGPVTLSIEDEKGAKRDASFKPEFARMFDSQALTFAGMTPRTAIGSVDKKSPANDKLKAGDVVLSIRRASDATLVRTPSPELFFKTVTDAGAAGDTLTIEVERAGQPVTVAGLKPEMKLPTGERGLGVGFAPDFDHVVVAAVADGSSAARANVSPGATIVSANGTPVARWSDLQRAIATGGESLQMTTTSPQGDETVTLALADGERNLMRSVRYANPILPLATWPVVRKTSNPVEAVTWGVAETRDLILQGYLTLRRVFGGSVPASNMSGPVGIFQAGTAFAQRGPDWFIWFLAVISANLAVVNFLPVPILDGWHFLGLIKEKITGKPMSEGVQVVAQYVGLAMILSLILFVTFNDITRLMR